MYEMVTGHVPFDGDSTVSVAIKHLQEEVPSPAEEVPIFPYSLECIILKCTQKNPSARYLSCEDLILDLKRSLVDPEEILLFPASTEYRRSDGCHVYGGVGSLAERAV